ncbi:MAG: CPBP family intramembrane metalloprotease [Chloroflexi bacterium]|nr:CPBP family intramembrane metalloprotease [Chloroflexota bacterium]
MALLALFLPHLMAASLVVVAVGFPRRASSTRRASRLRRYWHTMRWQWLCVALLVTAIPLAEILTLTRTAASTLFPAPALWFIVLGNLLLLMYAPIALAWVRPRLRHSLLAPFVRVRVWLPQTLRERTTWILLSMTTGICEEILFRGFALHYLMHGPLGLNLPLSIIIACLLFGLGHRYQGWRGMLQTCCFGAVMSGLFVATGSLLLPIVVHILVNLRIALLPPSYAHHHPTIGDLRPPTAHEAPKFA